MCWLWHGQGIAFARLDRDFATEVRVKKRCHGTGGHHKPVRFQPAFPVADGARPTVFSSKIGDRKMFDDFDAISFQPFPAFQRAVCLAANGSRIRSARRHPAPLSGPAPVPADFGPYTVWQ